MSDNWWEAAPLDRENDQPKQKSDDWWQAAPVAEEPGAAIPKNQTQGYQETPAGGMGAEVPPATSESETPAAQPTFGEQIGDFARGTQRGAVNTTGTMIKGLSTKGLSDPGDVLPILQELESAPNWSQQELADFYQRASRKLARSPALMRQLIGGAGDLAAGRAKSVADLPNLKKAFEDAIQDPRQTEAYALGQSIQEWARENYPADPRLQGKFQTQVAEGLGSIGPFLAAGILPGGQGFAAGAGILAGQGEALQNAVDAIEKGEKLSRKQLLDATGFGSLPGATESIPIETLLERIPKPKWAEALGSIGRIAAQAAIEGGQEAVQQVGQNLISKYVYRPDQAISEGVGEAAAVGAVVGGGLQATKDAGGAAVDLVRPARETKSDAEPQKATGFGRKRIEQTVNVDAKGDPQAVSRVAPTARPDREFEVDKRAQQIKDRQAQAILGEAGYTKDQIREMNADEFTAAMQEAADAGIEAPTREPSGDIAAQITDLQNPQHPRGGVYLPRSTVEHMRKTGQLDNALKAGRPIEDFDGRGGILIARDERVQQMATQAKAKGVPLQRIIGVVTQAGQGKPTNGDTVIQQRDEAGNVTRETLTTSGEAQGVMQEFAAPGRQVVQMTPDEALIDREDRAAQELTGRKEAPAKVETPDDLATAAQQADTQPTEAQKKAGNYKHAHVNVQGLDIAIENPKGSVRSGVDQDGEAWETTMPAHYGRIKRTTGADGDQVDVYLGDDLQSEVVYIVDQIDPKTGKFDEHKVVMGASSMPAAMSLYEGGFSDGTGMDRIGGIKALSMPQFKEWLKGDTSAPASGKAVQTRDAKPGAAQDAEIIEAAPQDVAPELAEQPAPANETRMEAGSEVGDGGTARADQPRQGRGDAQPSAAEQPAASQNELFEPFREYLKSGKSLAPDKVAEALGTDIKKAAGLLQEAVKNGGVRYTKSGKFQRIGTSNKPMGLIEALTRAGGIRDQDGELAAMDLDKQFGPGGRLVRKNGGMTLDEAREWAVDNGYIADTPWAGNETRTTTRDLLDAIREDAAGNKQVREQDVSRQQDIDRQDRERQYAEQFNSPAERAIVKAHGVNFMGELDEWLKGAGLTLDSIPAADLDRAAELVSEGMDIEAAVERSFIEAVEADTGVEYDADEIPFDTGPRDETLPTDPFEDGEERRPGREEDQRPAAQEAPAGRREDGQGDGEGQQQEVTSETGADGKAQSVILGTEQDVKGALQNKADAGLKAKADQKPMDDGLFGDSMNQGDLLDTAKNVPLLRAPSADLAKEAVLRSTKEGRRTVADPDSGNINWLIDNGYAEPETARKRAKLRLTDKGQRELARLEELSGYAQGQRDRQFAKQVAKPAAQKGMASKNVAKLLHQMGLDQAVMEGDNFQRRIPNPPYMDLVIERLPDPVSGQILSFAHYYEQNGDLVNDGEMIYQIGKDGQLTLSETISSGGYQSDTADHTFARIFSKNLLDQGFGKVKAAPDVDAMIDAAIDDVFTSPRDPLQAEIEVDLETSGAYRTEKGSEHILVTPSWKNATGFQVSYFQNREPMKIVDVETSASELSSVVRQFGKGFKRREPAYGRNSGGLERALNTAKEAEKELERRGKKTVKQSAASAARNVGQGLSEVLSGLNALFNDPNKLGSGPSFDEDTYRKALPHFRSGVAHFAEAGRDIAQMVRSLVQFLASNGMDRPAIERMKPYIARFITDVQAGKETIDVPGSDRNLEQDSGGATAEDGVGQAGVSSAAGTDGRSATAGGSPNYPRNERADPSSSVSESDAPAVGDRGDLAIPDPEPEPEPFNPADRDGERGSDAGVEGLPAERVTAEQVVETASNSPDLEVRRRQQAKAESTKVVPQDAANIAETLPMLYEGQRDDVLKVENRFAEADGMLLTNGTGTGKTFSGLGVIKRFAKQGKKNVLIIAPSQGILEAWVKAAKDLKLDISVLDSTSTAGDGLVATTYANLGQNRHLADREWDLAVSDEAHSLLQNADGEATSALKNFRAITRHPRGDYERAIMLHRDLYGKIEDLTAQIEARRAANPDATVDDLEDRRGVLYQQFEEKRKQVQADMQAKPRSKALFLSATPFAHHFTLDWAEGYLFDYPKDGDPGAYNAGDGRDRFFIENFGYRMRYNKLTKPESDVNLDIMEREFHDRLAKSGALSGRILEVDRDYDRKFVNVVDSKGKLIDQGFKWLSDNRMNALSEVYRKRFDYLARARLLEAMKAKGSADYLQKNLDMGRKVVVFHNYNEGGGFTVFPATENDAEIVTRVDGKEVKTSLKEQYQKFLAANPYVADLNFSDYQAPPAELKRMFGDRVAIYNGTVSKKQRSDALKAFNEKGSGIDLLVVQADAGSAGLSAHDTEGDTPRVLLNLGLPTKPTQAIQQEGRIYRDGQASDAMFRYMNTGTGWERSAFASTIAQRAGTAENLGMGNLARTLKESFITAYEESDTYPPGHEGEGTGGKAADRALRENVSDFERAKTHYFGQQKKSGRRDQREGTDYFATPEPIGLKLVEFIRPRANDRMLEPSAGHGAIARYLPETTTNTIIEPSNELLSRAQLRTPNAKPLQQRFEDLNIVNKFDGIVMNPPFGSGGKTAVDHLAKAVTHLRNGGRVAAIIPTGPAADKKFDKWYEDVEGVYMVADIQLPQVTFKRAGTGVMTRIVVLEKQTDENVTPPQQINRDYTKVEDINDLFDRIEQVELAERAVPETQEFEVPPDGPFTAGGIDFNLDAKNGADVAEVKSFIGGKFKYVVGVGEKHGGTWNGRASQFEFTSPGARAEFLQDLEANPEPAPVEAPSGVKFDLNETMHAKTGAKLWVASISERVERDVYTAILEVAKRHGGYYSTYRGRGAIPGFQFKSEETRQRFIDEMQGKDGRPSAAMMPRSAPMQARIDPAPLFYSALERAVEGMQQPRGPKTQWMAMIRKAPGVKPEEIEWTGVEQWLAEQSGTITKEQVLDYIRANQIDVQEVVKGGVRAEMSTYDMLDEMSDEDIVDEAYRYWGTDKDDIREDLERDRDGTLAELAREIDEVGARAGFTDGEDTKFEKYQLPGGEGYREMLLTLPEKDTVITEPSVSPDGWGTTDGGTQGIVRRGDHGNDYRSGHWDEPNVLAHVRFNERVEEAPYTAEEQAAIDARKAAQPEVNRLGNELARAITDRTRERDIILEQKREELRLKVRAGEIRIPEMQRQLDELTFGSGAVETEALKRQREIQDRYDALRDSLPPMPKRKTTRTLFIEEIQSDWHQQGRKRGYSREKLDTTGWRAWEDSLGFWNVMDVNGNDMGSYSAPNAEGAILMASSVPKNNTVPDAPFKTTWPELAFKRMLRWAVDNGYDRIAWTPGDVQAERYDLSKQISEVVFDDNASTGIGRPRMDGAPSRGVLQAYDLDGKRIINENIAPEQLPDYIGKEVADKLLNAAPVEANSTGLGVRRRILSGLDIQVGGEGMRGFYDQILPKTVNKLVKKWGGKVGTTKITPQLIRQNDGMWTNEDRTRLWATEAEAQAKSAVDVWSLDITDAMRDAAKAGLPLFLKPDERLNSNPLHQRVIPERELNMLADELQKVAQRVLGRSLREVQYVGADRVPNADAFGQYDFATGIIRVALLGPMRPDTVLRHEAIHALRRSGVITRPEYAILERKAKQWRKEYEIEDRYRQYFEENRSWYDDERLIEDHMNEEAIAEAFSDYHVHRAAIEDSRIRKIFDKLARFLEQVRNMLAGHGFTSADQIFADIEEGRIGARTPRAQQPSARPIYASDRPEPVRPAPVPQNTMANEAQLMQAAPDITQTPAFKEWFGDSKVVDAEGKPLVVYHGTAEDFVAFQDFTGGQDGIYFSANPSVASEYAEFRSDAVDNTDYVGAPGGSVMPTYLAIQNPLVVTDIPWFEADAYQEAIDRAKDEGRDGVIFRNVEDGPEGRTVPADTYVVFSPNQIKSVFNRGTFDSSDPRIMYQLPRNMVRLGDKIDNMLLRTSGDLKEFAHKARRAMQDRFIDVKRLQERLQEITGEKIPEFQDVYLTESLYYGKTAKRLDDMREEWFEPLMAKIQSHNLTLEEVNEFLYARHAKERNERIASINPNMQEAGSGMSDAEADAVMEAFARRNRMEALEDVAGDVDRLIDQSRRDMLKDGLISQEQYDQWREYDYYVPLRGWEADPNKDGEADKPRIGRRFDIRGKETKQALGRRSKADSPLAYVMMQAQQSVIRGEKNRVGKSFLRLVQANPDKTMWEIHPRKRERFINKTTGLVQERWVAEDWGDDILSVKIGGNPTFIKIKDPDIAKAMKGLGADNMGAIGRTLHKFNRFLSFMSTQANPEFVLTNLARDLQTAAVNLAENDIKGLQKSVLRDVPKAMQGIWQGVQGKRDTEWSKYYHEFADAGGKIGFFGLDTIEDHKKQMDKELQKLRPGAPQKAWNVIEHIGKRYISDANTSVENALRLSTYVNARRSGLTKAKAASLARELTVNFNRRGEWGTMANALYLFYNAGIQGSVRMIQALRHPKVQKLAFGITASAFMLDIFNRWMAGDDDDGENFYDKIPFWEKERNLIMMLPGGNGQYLKFPLPWGYNVFHVVGQQTAASMFGKETPGSAAFNVGKTALNAFNPIGGSDRIERMLSPTILDPFVDLGANKDYLDRKIMPEDYPGQVASPDSEKYWNTVNPQWKWVAKKLNELTGGNEVRPGAIDISPETLEYWTEFIAGGAGAFLARSNNFITKLVTGEDIEAYQVPFTRRFYGSPSKYADMQAYYDLRDRVRLTEKEFKLFRERSRIEEGRALQKTPEFKMVNSIKQADNQLRQLRKQIRALRADEKLKDAVKRQRIERLEDRMLRIMEAARGRYNTLKE
jgi:hypothetical protein